MMEDDNVAKLKRLLLEGFGAASWSTVDDVVSETVIEHQHGAPSGREAVKALIRGLRQAFPDLRYEVVHTAANGDIAWGHFRAHGTNTGPFMGMPPTGKSMVIDVIDIGRFERGKLVEHWGVPDRLACLLQLGHFPPPKP
jgi:predicted ester cyclase